MRLGVQDTHFLLWYFSLQHLKGKPHKNLEEENKLLVYRSIPDIFMKLTFKT